MYNADADLAAIFADQFDTVAVVKGGTTVQGFRNKGPIVPTDGLGLEVQETRDIISIIASQLTLAYDDAVTVGGVAGKVREQWPAEDGKITQFVFVSN